MADNIDIIKQMTMNNLTNFIESLGVEPFPIVYHDEGLIMFSYAVESLHNKLKQQVDIRLADDGNYLLTLHTFFVTDDKVNDGFTIYGVPLGSVAVDTFMIDTPDDDEDLFRQVYKAILNNTPGLLEQLLR